MTQKGINVLSLFDGMSCGQLALKKAGVQVNNYFASEIDKHAITITQKNFPATQQLGDVTQVDPLNLPEIDLLIGGSPCQGFSFAGKQLNFEDPRSKLFFDFVRIYYDCMPRYFLLENVKMKKQYIEVINKILGVEPIEINSKLLSAQNRSRLYWTNIPNITTPEDLGLVLEDVMSYKDLKMLTETSYAKLDTKLTLENRLDLLEINYKNDGQRSKGCKLASQIINDTPSKVSRQGDRLYSILGKSPCLTTGGQYKIDAGSPFQDDWCLIPITTQERLQTVPDGYTQGVPDTRRAHMLGNGWTVDVIAHIFKNMEV